jgi:micrococcal nuclease
MEGTLFSLFGDVDWSKLTLVDKIVVGVGFTLLGLLFLGPQWYGVFSSRPKPSRPQLENNYGMFSRRPKPSPPELENILKVIWVTGGDTIQLCCVFGNLVKVRYIGIDSLETHHSVRGVEPYGTEASEANRKLVDGKTVTLEFDVQQQDKYGRTLAYVYLEDGTFVNAWLVENGYAQVMTVRPNVKHESLFLRLQREAREAKRGLWR